MRTGARFRVTYRSESDGTISANTSTKDPTPYLSAIALSVTADELVFDKNERGPDDALLLQFEAISRFDDDEKKVIREILAGMILRHEARRWAATRQGRK